MTKNGPVSNTIEIRQWTLAEQECGWFVRVLGNLVCTTANLIAMTIYLISKGGIFAFPWHCECERGMRLLCWL